jgi:hypothetical protein
MKRFVEAEDRTQITGVKWLVNLHEGELAWD